MSDNYLLNNSSLIKVGTWSNCQNATIDCTSIQGYNKLTDDNFIPVTTSHSVSITEWICWNKSVSLEKTYSAKTGTLTLRNLGLTYTNSSGVNCGYSTSSGVVYCVK